MSQEAPTATMPISNKYMRRIIDAHADEDLGQAIDYPLVTIRLGDLSAAKYLHDLVQRTDEGAGDRLMGAMCLYLGSKHWYALHHIDTRMIQNLHAVLEHMQYADHDKIGTVNNALEALFGDRYAYTTKQHKEFSDATWKARAILMSIAEGHDLYKYSPHGDYK